MTVLLHIGVMGLAAAFMAYMLDRILDERSPTPLVSLLTGLAALCFYLGLIVGVMGILAFAATLLFRH